jgi:hypothetical protein
MQASCFGPFIIDSLIAIKVKLALDVFHFSMAKEFWYYICRMKAPTSSVENDVRKVHYPTTLRSIVCNMFMILCEMVEKLGISAATATSEVAASDRVFLLLVYCLGYEYGC